MRKSLKSVIAMALSAAMVFSVGSVLPASGGDAPITTGAVAQAATAAAVKTYSYHAYLNFQTDYNWLFRSEWYGKEAGLKSTSYSYEDANSKKQKAAFSYSKNFCKAGPGFGKYKSGGVFGATMQDVEITKNGTYTVGISGIDLSPSGEGLTLESSDKLEDNVDNFNMLSVCTDISKKVPGAKFSNLSLNIDGKTIATGIEAFPKFDSIDSNKNAFYNLMLINQYGSKANGDAPKWMNANGTISVKNLTSATKLQKTLPSKYMPKKSISITFTVSGIDFTKDPNTYLNKPSSNSNSSSSSSSTVGVKKGKTFKKGNLKYKVLTAAKSGKSGKVAVVGVVKKTQKSYSVPKTVKYSSKAKYTVTTIASNAFKSCSKATKITLGSAVKTISKNAFKNCKKLSSIKVSAKLSKVSKGAFSGCKKTIKVSGKSVSANKKKLKKSGYKKFK